MKHYAIPENLDRDTAVKMLRSKREAESIPALLSLTHYDSDPAWVSTKLVEQVEDKKTAVRIAALQCLLTLSRTRNYLNVSEALAVALKHVENKSEPIYLAAHELLDEILSSLSAKKPPPLNRLVRVLEIGGDLEKMVAVAQLFLHETPRARIKEIAKPILEGKDALLKARFLTEVRPFLIVSDEEFDLEYATLVMGQLKRPGSIYLERRIVDFKNWLRFFSKESGSAKKAARLSKTSKSTRKNPKKTVFPKAMTKKVSASKKKTKKTR